MRLFFTYFIVFAGAVSFFISCTGGSNCRELTGHWEDREGHEFVFDKNGKALWLNKFGQLVDTVQFAFELDCNTSPASVNFSAFSGGPFLGKTLFGILEFSGDTLFRLCYETGQQPESRPKAFDPDQTMKFYR